MGMPYYPKFSLSSDILLAVTLAVIVIALGFAMATAVKQEPIHNTDALSVEADTVSFSEAQKKLTSGGLIVWCTNDTSRVHGVNYRKSTVSYKNANESRLNHITFQELAKEASAVIPPSVLSRKIFRYQTQNCSSKF